MTEFFARKVIEHLVAGELQGSHLPAKDLLLEHWWAQAQEADWMLQLAELIGIDPHTLLLTGCAIAETVVHLVPWQLESSRLALLMARRWARGHASALNADLAHRACWEEHRDRPSGSVEGAATFAISAATRRVDGRGPHLIGASTAALHTRMVLERVGLSASSHGDIVRKYIPWDLIEGPLLSEKLWALKFGK